jgi:hypothetical protein
MATATESRTRNPRTTPGRASRTLAQRKTGKSHFFSALRSYTAGPQASWRDGAARGLKNRQESTSGRGQEKHKTWTAQDCSRLRMQLDGRRALRCRISRPSRQAVHQTDIRGRAGVDHKRSHCGRSRSKRRSTVSSGHG